jgi:hypothetical protein
MCDMLAVIDAGGNTSLEQEKLFEAALDLAAAAASRSGRPGVWRGGVHA